MSKFLSILAALMLSAQALLAQTTVTGVVTDAESGDPLEGVAVLVKGTTIGMFSDAQGKYALEVPASGTVLLFTFVGKKTTEEAINGRGTINVSMEPDILQIDEVVVTAVGLETNRRALGYSVQNIDGDEIVNSRETNIVNALNSKVAGVTVVSSAGSPGASANIRVRGSTSINGSNSPLFVIDGVPIDNSTSGNGVAGVDNANRAIDINPNDVESMTVLKGAAATALYGIRAANGAIIVTTKSGKRGKPRVTITGAYTIDEANKLPERQTTYAQGRPSGGEAIYRGPETFEGFSWGPEISSLEYDGATDYPFSSLGRLVPSGTGNGTPAQAYDPYTFFVRGSTYDLNASVSGGNDASKYYISGGRLYSQGIVPNADFARNSFRVRAETKVSSKLTLGMSANFVNSGGRRMQRGSNLRGIMLGLLRNTPTFDVGNGKVGQEAADDPSTYILADGSQRSYRAGIYDNPYWVINKNYTTDDVNRIIGFASASYELTPALKLIYKLGIDNFSDRRLGQVDINPGWTVGTINQSTQSSNDLNSDLLLQFTKSFGDLDIAATAGHNFFSTRVVTQSATGTTLATPDFYNISNATDIVASEGISRRKLIGAFATVDVGFADYLFLNLTGRNDWSSTLPKENNSFQSWSTSLGFAFTEALGMSENPILPYGKIRLSYGKVGNDAPIYATTNYFNGAFSGGDGFISGITFPAFGLNAFERDIQLGNPELRPEKTTTFEVGAELKFFQGRLGADVTYFDQRSQDQVIAVQLPATTGFTSLVRNAGSISSKGWEVVLSGSPIRTDNFNWDISVNFTAIENTVDSLADGIEEIGLSGFVSTSSRAVAGFPYGAIWGNGFQQDENGNTLIGTDGFPLQDPDKTVQGDPNPDWIMGLRNTFSFKGVSLSVLLDFRQGGDMWCGTCGIIDYFGTSAVSGEQRNDTRVFEGVSAADGSVNTQSVGLADPAAGLGANYWVRYGFGGIAEMSVYDTSWQRLREVTLSYDLPGSILAKLPVEGLGISLTGRNLWLNTTYPGIDPETNLTGASNGIGLDYFNNPNTRSYGATVRVTF